MKILQKIDGNCQRGFSLLEILVAFSILSIMLGILLKIFSGGVRVAEITGNYAEAVQIAESLLADVGIEEDLAEGEQQGEIDAIYRWQIDTKVFTPDVEAWEPALLPVIPYQIDVTVSWPVGEGERSFSLTTLRLGQSERD